MGILNFYLNLNKKFGSDYIGVIRDLRSTNIHKIYFDLNNLLYPVAIHASEGTFTNTLTKLIEKTVFDVLPKSQNGIYFFLDGVAPRAKLLTQRDRRNQEVHFFNSFHKKSSNFKTNPLNFTPGTLFMRKFANEMMDYVKRKSIQRGYEKTNFQFSSSDSQGEGEYKIFSHIAQTPSITENILVIGADSDLILFGLLAPVEKHVFVLKNLELYDTKKLRAQIIREAGNHHLDATRSLHDFAFLSILSGNDYIPKLRGFSFRSAWTQYTLEEKYLIRYQNDKLEIDFDILNKICQNNKETEHEKRETKGEVALLMTITFGLLRVYPEYETIDGFVHVRINGTIFGRSNSLGRRGKEEAAKNALEMIQNGEDFLKMISHLKITRFTLIKEIQKLIERDLRTVEQVNEEIGELDRNDVKLYFEGLCWIFNFLHGRCNHPQFYFVNRPVSDSHLISISGKISFEMKERSTQNLVPFSCALALLPPTAKHFVSKHVHCVFDDENLKDLFHGSYKELRKVWNREETTKRLEVVVAEIKKEVEKSQATVSGFNFESDLIVVNGRVSRFGK